MFSSFWIAIIVIVLRLLLFYTAIIFGPAILIKFSRKSLTIWTAAAISVLCVVLPLLSLVNNNLVLDDFNSVFWIWGISGSLYRLLSWTFTSGAVVSYFYAGLLIWMAKSPTYGQVLSFIWVGMLMNCVAMIAIPYWLYGGYGIRMAYDDSVFLGTTLVLTSAVTYYILRSKNCKEIISD